MALSRVTTWIAAEVLTASALNAEFDNILNNAISLISPVTAALDMNGFEFILDADGDTSFTADTDDRIDVRIGGTDIMHLDSKTAMNVIAVRKTADESVTTSTTLQDDDELTFAIAASEEWVVNFDLFAAAAFGTTGLKVAVTVPSGATLNYDFAAIDDAGSVDMDGTSTSGSAITFASADFAGTIAKVSGILWVLNSTNAGSVTLQFAQATSSGTAVTLLSGSSLKAIRMA